MYRNNTIHVNHLGFRPDDPFKRAILPLGPQESGLLGEKLLQVIQMSEFIKHPLDSPGNRGTVSWRGAKVETTPLGRYAVCEFGDITARGGYQVVYGDVRSYPFLVYRDVWKRCFRVLMEWYRVASCGEAVPGYHEICHLDDCRMADTGEQADLVGGWHDAGDLRKWTSTMSYVTLALADFLVEAPKDLSTIGVDPDLAWRQIKRGAKYLRKMIDPSSGLVWHSVASDVKVSNESGVWTDNIPGSGDERGSKRDCPIETADLHVQTLAALAVLLRERDKTLSDGLLADALRIWKAARPILLKEGGVERLVDCSFRLWRATNDQVHAEAAAEGLASFMARQVKGVTFEQDKLQGFFVINGRVEGGDVIQGRGGRNLYLFAKRAGQFAAAVQLWPNHANAGRWKDALSLLLNGCVEPMIRLNPYLALPACLCSDADHVPGARPLAGRLQFRYFGNEAEGNNCQLAETASNLALAARVLGEPRWAAYGQKQLDWIMGFNPFETSMMTGLGYSQAAVFSFYVGQIPGAIINGYTGGADDCPLLCMNREASPMNMEYWSIHTAAMLQALATLENERLG